MASISKVQTTKSGKKYFKISVSRGYGVSPYTCRFYPQDTWSAKVVQRELAKFTAEFELKCKNGEVKTRAEKKAEEAQQAAEAAKIKTLRQYVDGVWFPNKNVVIAEGTRSNYRIILEKHVLPELGELHMKDITPAMLSALFLKMSENYAFATVSKLYKTVANIFQEACFDDTIALNPMSKVRKPTRRKDELVQSEAEKAYTAEELNHIFECITNESLMWQTYIHFAADSACRRGECVGVRWNDINFDTGECKIQCNVQYTPTQGVYTDTPKSGRLRTIDLGPETLSLLRRWRQEQASLCVSQWVFAKSPKPINPQSVNKAFKRIAKRHGFEHFHPHILRHTSASLSIANGGDVAAVSKRLGHSSPSITLSVYTHSFQNNVRKAGEAARQAVKAVKD